MSAGLESRDDGASLGLSTGVPGVDVRTRVVAGLPAMIDGVAASATMLGIELWICDGLVLFSPVAAASGGGVQTARRLVPPPPLSAPREDWGGGCAARRYCAR